MYGMDHTSRHKVQPRSTAWTTPVGRIPPGLPDGERGRGGALAFCVRCQLVQGSVWEEGEGNGAGCSAVAVVTREQKFSFHTYCSRKCVGGRRRQQCRVQCGGGGGGYKFLCKISFNLLVLRL